MNTNLSDLSPDELTRLGTEASHFEMRSYAATRRMRGIPEEELRTLEIDFPVFYGPLEGQGGLDIPAELTLELPNKDD